MTRKRYEIIATTIGGSMRDYEPGSQGWDAVWHTAALLSADLKAANPRFDPLLFLNWVRDVAQGRRDLDGKKVAA